MATTDRWRDTPDMDPFDTLGLPPAFDLDRQELERRYRDLQRALHPDRHVDGSASTRRESLSRAVDVNEAYRILKRDIPRAEALLKRLGAEVSEDSAKDPAFLMEIMELREELSEAKASKDLARVGQFGERARAEARQAIDSLRTQLGAAAQGDEGAKQEAAATLGRLRYFRRLEEEVESIEEEALA